MKKIGSIYRIEQFTSVDKMIEGFLDDDPDFRPGSGDSRCYMVVTTREIADAIHESVLHMAITENTVTTIEKSEKPPVSYTEYSYYNGIRLFVEVDS